MKNTQQKDPGGSLLLELDEAIRRERVEKLWQKYGQQLILFVVAIVLATAIYSGYSAWNESVNKKDTEKLMALLEAKDFPENIQPEALGIRGPLRGIALINAGGNYVRAGKTDKALEMYKAAANDSGVNSELLQLALLMQARLTSNTPDHAEDIEALLKPVLKDKKSPWQPYALIEAAAFTASKNDYPAARAHLAQILENENLLPSLHNKARALDQLYAAKQQQAGTTTEKQGS